MAEGIPCKGTPKENGLPVVGSYRYDVMNRSLNQIFADSGADENHQSEHVNQSSRTSREGHQGRPQTKDSQDLPKACPRLLGMGPLPRVPYRFP